METTEIILLAAANLLLLLMLIRDAIGARGEIKRFEIHSAKTLDVLTATAKTHDAAASGQTRAAVVVSEAVAAQSKKLEAALSEMEQRWKEASTSAGNSADARDAELRSLVREMRREAQERSGALNDGVKIMADHLKQSSTSIQQRIADDTVARDSRLVDFETVLQKESESRSLAFSAALKGIAESVSSDLADIRQAFSSEEQKRSIRA